MVESSLRRGTTETEIHGLKEAIHAKQQQLQKVQSELDVEREAAATAASEALSMILRLQGEKAAMRMEASQYKRMAEEKMCHAEECHELLEEVIYEKQMEIASLEFQIQAYRCKLLSLGCTDIGVIENRLPESLLLHSNLLNWETGITSSMRRMSSLPVIKPKINLDENVAAEKERLTTWEENKHPEVSEETLDLRELVGDSTDLNSYWEHIGSSNQIGKEVSDCKDSTRGKSPTTSDSSESSKIITQISSCQSCNEANDGTSRKHQARHILSLHESEPDNSASSTSSVYDVFEVPQADKPLAANAHKKEEQDDDLDTENMLEKPDFVPQKNVNETDLIRKKLHLQCVNHANNMTKLCKFREGTKLGRRKTLPLPTGYVAASQTDFEQLALRVERLESDRSIRNQECQEGKVELLLLKEIRDQLDFIQLELRKLRPRKQTPRNESALLPFTEVMLRTWL